MGGVSGAGLGGGVHAKNQRRNPAEWGPRSGLAPQTGGGSQSRLLEVLYQQALALKAEV
jgi:hypothetical protein